ncbi:FdhE protein [Desulfitispora alkaliphila]|uniref:formate dehydrogenase accessory protein FdhE n=1 Tax=Desulfitispora alkaliphila TaxID=622674 RepID=UPI003D25ADCA
MIEAKEQVSYSLPTEESFYKELSELYSDLAVSMELTVQPDQDEFRRIMHEGKAALGCFPPSIGINTFKEALEKVVDIFNKYQPQYKSDAIEKIMNDSLGDKVASILRGGTLEENFDLSSCNPNWFQAVFTYALKPFLKSYSQYIGEQYPLDEWKQGYCPGCGQSAAMARLSKEKDGKRYLWCPMCELEWNFKRIGCPSCLEENPEKLGYFRVEDKDDGYKVNVCYQCKRYIKTYNEKDRLKSKRDIFLEEKKTGYLDYLALREGFIPMDK